MDSATSIKIKTLDEWEERWEKIFKPKVFLNQGMKKLINKIKDQGKIR